MVLWQPQKPTWILGSDNSSVVKHQTHDQKVTGSVPEQDNFLIQGQLSVFAGSYSEIYSTCVSTVAYKTKGSQSSAKSTSGRLQLNTFILHIIIYYIYVASNKATSAVNHEMVITCTQYMLHCFTRYQPHNNDAVTTNIY